MINQEPVPRDSNRPLLLGLVAFFFISYWLFAWALERIDLTAVMTTWWQTQLGGIPLPGLFIFMAEMLHPRVLRHLIPPVVGWLLAYYATVYLVQTLYDLPDRQAAQRFLNRLRLGGAPAGGTTTVRWQTLHDDREHSVLLRVGGPGAIRVNNGDAVVSERNGRFYRIFGAGAHTLERFEYVYNVVDLRPQEREVTDIPLVTRDGIQITADVHVVFRVRTGGDVPTRAHPFPFDPEAVRQAAYTESVLPDGSVSNWMQQPANQVRRLLPRIVARYPLDKLLHPSSQVDPNLAIREDLLRQMRLALETSGLELTSLHVGRLELPQAVSEQYIDYWRAHLDSQIRLRQAESQAFALEEKEIARIEAEATIMNAIAEGVQRARRDGHRGNLREIVALRLVEALERMARQSEEAYPLPGQLLPRLEELRQALGSGAVTAPGPGGEDKAS